jgi:hypothetical protein
MLTVGLQDANNLVAGEVADETDSVRVAQNDTDLGGSKTLLGELADEFLGLIRRGLQPAGSTAAVRNGRTRNTLTKDGWMD